MLPASVKEKPHLIGCLWPGHLAGPHGSASIYPVDGAQVILSGSFLPKGGGLSAEYLLEAQASSRLQPPSTIQNLRRKEK